MKRMARTGCCLLCGFCSTYSIANILKMEVDDYAISNSIFGIILFVGIYVFMQCSWGRFNKRLLTATGLLGLLFSAFLVLGRNVYMRTGTLIDKPYTWIYIAGMVPLMTALLAVLFRHMPVMNDRARVWAADAMRRDRIRGALWIRMKKAEEADRDGKKCFLWCWFLIFAAWLPGFIASYPGVCGYDVVYELNYFNSEFISIKHTLIHTYLMHLCVDIIGGVLHSVNAGYAISNLLQMICLSFVLAAVIKYMKKRRIAFMIRTVFLLVFMFLPSNAIMAFSTTKDVYFASFMALFVKMSLEWVEDGNLLCQRKFLMRYIAVSFLFMIFRSQGKYIFVAGMFAGVALMKRQRRRLLAILGIVSVMYALYAGPVTKLAGAGLVEGQDIREMMSVPTMQLTRALHKNFEELTEEERELIRIYVPASDQMPWVGIADNYKGSFNADRFRDKPGEFIGLWIKVGAKAPVTYVDAFARLTVGLWYPDVNYRDPGAYHPYWEYLNLQQNSEGTWTVAKRRTPECLQWLADWYYDLTYNNTYQKIPILSMLFSSGFMCWILLGYFAYCFYMRQRKYLFPAFFVLLLWGTMLLGPVVLYRYVYPIAITTPLLITSALTMREAD